MRILVTGGTGFVGSHLVDALLARDADVVCLVRSEAKAARLFPDRPPQLVQGSLDDDQAMTRAVGDVDVVYHVAGLIAARTRKELFRINVDATRRLASLARQHAPQLRRFVYVSSLAAAGPTTRGHPIDEVRAPAPVSAYGESKLGGENAVRHADIPWTIIRPPAVYGPRDTEFLKLVKLVRSPLVPLMGRPDQELSFVYVDDLTAALLLATDDAALERTYFASHSETVTGHRLLRVMALAVRGPNSRPPWLVPVPALVTRLALASTGAAARVFGHATVLNRDKANEFLAEAWTCSADALSRDTGWEAETASAEGWKKTVAWYRQHGWL